MQIFRLIKQSLKTMKLNVSRTFLTVLGVVIGISSIMIVFSSGEGLRSLIVGQIQSYGSDILIVEIRMPSNKKGMAKDLESGASMAMGVQITTLNADDVEDINKLPNVKSSYGGIIGQEKISFGSESKKAMLYGVGSSFIDIDQGKIEYGQFFTDEDEKSLSRVAVLGSDIKESLFAEQPAIGKMVKIGNSKYRIIGVIEERGSVMGMNFDDFVYLPLKTLQKRVLGIDHVVYSVHQLNDVSRDEETAEEIRGILRINHDISEPDDKLDTSKDDFRVTSMTEMLSMMDVVTDMITWLLVAIVAVSLVVGGIGIMNIMYVIVSERTKEIGLRKAVGAKYSDIMLQFLVESILITSIGGIMGTFVGVIISYLIAIVAQSFELNWIFKIPLSAYLVSLIFSVFFGVIFGLYPASKAARMNPIDALRKD